jgi:predicted Fe-S protein YdhL (DUF1289 family)
MSLVEALPARAAAVRDAPLDLPVPSPCTSVCKMSEASGLCGGCLRTLDEIAAWGSLDEAGKRKIWLRIEERCEQLFWRS